MPCRDEWYAAQCRPPSLPPPEMPCPSELVDQQGARCVLLPLRIPDQRQELTLNCRSVTQKELDVAEQCRPYGPAQGVRFSGEATNPLAGHCSAVCPIPPTPSVNILAVDALAGFRLRGAPITPGADGSVPRQQPSVPLPPQWRIADTSQTNQTRAWTKDTPTHNGAPRRSGAHQSSQSLVSRP